MYKKQLNMVLIQKNLLKQQLQVMDCKFWLLNCIFCFAPQENKRFHDQKEHPSPNSQNTIKIDV